MTDADRAKPDDELLRLIALDQDDLAIVSAHVQDAVLLAKDIAWLSADKHFVLAMNRFAWEAAPQARGKRDYQRRRSALHFARVEKVQSIGIDRDKPDQALELLAISFERGNSPSGDVVVSFAGGATIRLSVEVLEVELSDLGPAWSTPYAPRHILA